MALVLTRRNFLDIDRAVVSAQSSFLYGFAQGWVRVADAANIFRRGTKLDRHGGFGNQLTCCGANNVHTQHAVCLLVGQHLNKAIGHAQCAGTAIGKERELAGLVSNTLVLELLFRKAHGATSGHV